MHSEPAIVALDATYSIGSGLSGVGLYSREILSGLAAAHPEARFRFCYRPHRFLRSRGIPLPRNATRTLLAEPLMPRRADLFHGLNQRLPRVPIRRMIATFHDLFVMTGEYSSPDFRRRFTEQATNAARRADLIIAVSEFTKGQVVSLLGVPESRVRVVHHGARRLPPLASPVKRERVILNVGAIQKRKNIARLVDAFERVDSSWRLVLIGSQGYGSAEILEHIETSAAGDRISVLGYLSATDLAEWYARATIFAFPSLDEGFGMPLLEAMQAGLPIVTSSRSALPEVAGDAAVLVDPESTGALAEALVELVRNEQLRADLTANALRRVERFSWERAVRETWDAYREVLAD